MSAQNFTLISASKPRWLAHGFASALLALSPIMTPSLASANEYVSLVTAAKNGEILIECACVMPSGTALQCSGLRVFDVGRPRHQWRQSVHGKKGTQVNLSEACYRKRDAEGMGSGLCCEASAREVNRLFAGKVLND